MRFSLLFYIFLIQHHFQVDLTPVQHTLSLILVIISSIINIFCIISLYHKHKISSSTAPTSNSSDTQLFIISFIETIIESIEAGITVYTSLEVRTAAMKNDFTGYNFVFVNNSWFIDLTIFSRPLLLCLGSKQIRRAIYNACIFSKAHTITVIMGKSNNKSTF